MRVMRAMGNAISNDDSPENRSLDARCKRLPDTGTGIATSAYPPNVRRGTPSRLPGVNVRKGWMYVLPTDRNEPILKRVLRRPTVAASSMLPVRGPSPDGLQTTARLVVAVAGT